MIVHNQVQIRNQTSSWPFWILTKLYPTLEDLTGPHPNPQRIHALCFSSVWIGQSPQMQTWGMGKMMQNIFIGAKKKKMGICPERKLSMVGSGWVLCICFIRK